MTSDDADIGKWVVKMTVSLAGYPLVKIDEYFSVQIDSCILNALTLNPGPVNLLTSSNPKTFSLDRKSVV